MKKKKGFRIGLILTHLLMTLDLAAGALPSATRTTVAQAPTPTPLEQDFFRFNSVTAKNGMVVSAEPMASQVGADILRQGGNAVDAAVATAFALAVTLPRAGNIGGGGFLLLRTPKGQVEALDFREMAPNAAWRDMFLDGKGDRDAQKATVGGLCVGVPGTVAGMDAVLKKYGTMTLRQVIEPARRLAARGYKIPASQHDEIERVTATLGSFPESRKIFFPRGQAVTAGSVLKQTDLAESLKAIEEQGIAGFYSGPVAEKIVASVTRHKGVMTLEDLGSYQAIWRQPVRGSYRGVTVWSMPPPSSGGVHLIQSLNVLAGYDMAASGHNSALTIHHIIETLRQVYADRSRWLGDPDFVKVPIAWLTSQSYATQIRTAIPEKQARSSKDIQPGDPKSTPGQSNRLPGYESPQTTHFCTVDGQGMAVSMTYTLNFSYGSGLVADGTGILLNDELDDFSAAPGKPNGFGLLGGEANAIAPRKRPLSSMTPTILEKDGKLLAVLGSPGGSHIITVVLQVILNLVDFGCNAQTAVCDPRMHHQWYPDQVEIEDGFSPDTLALLKNWGHKVVRTDCIGQAMTIVVRPDGSFEGGADPRRMGGTAVGY